MTQDDAHRGAPDGPPPSAGGDTQRQPDRPPLPSYGGHGATAGNSGSAAGNPGSGGGSPGSTAAGQQGYGMHPAYGPPPGYGQQPYAGQPPYGQPAYGQSAYGQPAYPPPGYGFPPGYGYPRPTNTLAILALVMAFVVSPVGLVLGIVARRQIRQTGEQGDGLALAGIIVGGIGTALAVLVFVFFFLALATAGSVDVTP